MFSQGQLDSLCGVYATINAVSTLMPQNKMTQDTAEEFFYIAIEYLNDKRKLIDALEDGLTIRRIHGILNAFKPCLKKLGYNLKYERITKGSGNIQGVFNTVYSFLGQEMKTAVIVGVEGKYNHWTTITSSTKNQWKLTDSIDLKVINRSRLTTGNLNGCDIIIKPSEVIGVWLE